MTRSGAPKRFAADSLNNGDAATRSQLARLKREWRKEWEEERAAQDALAAEEALAQIDAQLDRMIARDKEAKRLALEWRGDEDGEEG